MQTINSNWEGNQISFPRFKKYNRRGIIFRQGECSEGFYLLKHGSIKLQKTLPNGSQSILKIITPGEIFGEGEAIEGKIIRNNAFAIALEEDTLVQKLSTINLQESSTGIELIQKLLHYSLQTSHRLERLNWMDAVSRIKLTLAELAQKMGKRYGDETLLKLNLSHEELAMLTDSSRQTVTKTLSTLKKEGIISYSRNRILFRNLETFN